MINLPFFRHKTNAIKPKVLVVIDGFGLAPASDGNAISLSRTPNFNYYLKNYPHSELIASGESVGLPANEVGNTEVGHLILGAGRVVLQDLKRINLAIEKGTFYYNKAFLDAASHVKKYNSKLHIMGLASSGNVHSSLEHLYAVLQFCKKEALNRVFLHLFTDGRDAPPKNGIEIVESLERHLSMLKVGQIASICGRYYAMDRDKRWDRTAKAYKAIVLGHAIQTFSALDALKGAYLRGQTDEFIEPTIIANKNGPVATVGDNDAVIFFNYRIDRPRQLTMAFTLKDFENLKSFDFGYSPEIGKIEGEVKMHNTFKRERVLNNLFFVTMTEYHKNIPVAAIAFPPQVIDKPLAEIISDAGLRQLHMAESEKERFVTYYFDGMKEKAYPGEEVAIVPSPKVATYDKKPEMSLDKLIDQFIRQLNQDKYHFFVINFANPDMVAHTGNIKATVRAIETVDRNLARLVNAVLGREGTVLVTGDHGNCEEMLTFPTSSFFYTSSQGTMNTDHSNNPVPLLVIDQSLKGSQKVIPKAGLSDVAPTVLSLMGIKIPEFMTGKILLEVRGAPVTGNR